MKNYLVDGMQYANYKDGAVIALLAILMVFAILLLIIFLTDLITKLAGKETEAKENVAVSNTNTVANPLNVNDEDAVIASLIASIDYRNETKKNIQVVSVREVK